MKPNKRTYFMSGVLIIGFCMAFLLIAGRFLYIQASGTVDGVSLKEWAKDNRQSSYMLEAERGKIFDKHGMVLAYDRTTYRLYAILDENYSSHSDTPLHVTDIQKTAQKLAEVLDVEESSLIDILEQGKENGRFQVEFGRAGRQLDQDIKDEIEALQLPGIYFEKEPRRYYPNGIFASHIIGFARNEQVESDGGFEERTVGVTGIEKEMDELLMGEDGFVSFQRDRYAQKLLDPEEIVKQPVDGHDIILTIDQKIQILLEDVLNDVDEQYEPERITALVVHAKTGQVLAMSNRPSYDPNHPVDVQNWYNDAISTPFEPGSTIKMFTWAAAIEEGVYHGNETYESGSYQVNPRIDKINDHNGGKGWGEITYDEGFARSSNVAASKLVWEKLGTETFLEYLEAFHFNQSTNIDLPGEIIGKILYNHPIEKLTAAFGQGSTITPMQQVKAATAIANDGQMMQPYVIHSIVDSNSGNAVQQSSPTVVGEPISAATAKQTRELLYDAVYGTHGTGKPFQLNDYTVAGKTGTAQIPNPEGPGYLTGRNNYVFSFLGMAPKDDPELIMYVSVTKPQLDGQPGSAPVSYIFKTVMENALHYSNVKPDVDADQRIRTEVIPKVEGESVETLVKQLEEQGLHVTVVGKGPTVTQANVEEGDQVFQNHHVILVTEEPTMPNVIGWSLREVHQLAELLGLQLETIGEGFVVEQSLSENAPLHEGDYLVVELKPPTFESDSGDEREEDSPREPS